MSKLQDGIRSISSSPRRPTISAFATENIPIGRIAPIICDWCERWATEIAPPAETDGSFFLNLGASPSNPMLPHELVLRLRELFVLQNTIHWIKAITIETNRRRIDFARTFQADQFAAISERLPRIRFSSHTRRPDADRSARARRSLCGQEQHRALEPHAAGAIVVVAATPGSFLTKPSSAARKSARIRRRFRSSWRRIASGCTA